MGTYILVYAICLFLFKVIINVNNSYYLVGNRAHIYIYSSCILAWLLRIGARRTVANVISNVYVYMNTMTRGILIIVYIIGCMITNQPTIIKFNCVYHIKIYIYKYKFVLALDWLICNWMTTAVWPTDGTHYYYYYYHCTATDIKWQHWNGKYYWKKNAMNIIQYFNVVKNWISYHNLELLVYTIDHTNEYILYIFSWIFVRKIGKNDAVIAVNGNIACWICGPNAILIGNDDFCLEKKWKALFLYAISKN